jgi:glutamyl-tRNA synthetase
MADLYYYYTGMKYNMGMEVRTRFAPSPTGLMHIGGVRTALYAYLVAKKSNGQFSLRIEDTDRARLVEGATEDIIDTLKWLGLNFDGEVEYQSKRKDIYKEYADKLVKEEKAYEKEGAIWFKIDTSGSTIVSDLVSNRTIEIPNKDQKDFVILKSDGFPTYHLAHVVDDHLMETNPVIRGPEWISSLPKHVQLFKALGFEVTPYAHIPVILGPDKSKLSKRHGAKAASEFRKDGFLPEAILNYMAFLGWTPPSGKEILTKEEMAKEFDLKDVHVSSPVFDVVKLEWMNGEYIRQMSDTELTKRLQEFLVDHPAKEKIGPVVPLVKERIKKLSDFIPLTNFLWEAPEYEKEVFEKLKIEDMDKVLEKVLETLENMKSPWDSQTFEETFRNLAEELKLSPTQMFQLIRVAISGQTVTPPLFESVEILGEEETTKRVKSAMEFGAS